MQSFHYTRAADIDEAMRLAARAGSGGQVRFLAGGTTLVDLMKLDVETPAHVIDINGLDGLDQVEVLSGGGVRLGPLVRTAALAPPPHLPAQYPFTLPPFLAGAPDHLRTQATPRDNPLQPTRLFALPAPPPPPP